MAGTSSRGNPAMADVVRSVAVLGLIVLAIWGFGRFFSSTPKEPTSSVDYAVAARQVADAVSFEVLAPERLPEGWRATSARLDSGRWHLGVVTKGDDYVGLEQAERPAPDLIKQSAPDSKTGKSVSIAGEPWMERLAADGDVTYVRTQGKLTTLVTGSVSSAALQTYIESLTPVQKR